MFCLCGTIKQKCVLCNAKDCGWEERDCVWFSIWTCKCSVSVCWKAPVSLSNCFQTGVLKYFLRSSRHRSQPVMTLWRLLLIYFFSFFCSVCIAIRDKQYESIGDAFTKIRTCLHAVTRADFSLWDGVNMHDTNFHLHTFEMCVNVLENQIITYGFLIDWIDCYCWAATAIPMVQKTLSNGHFVSKAQTEIFNGKWKIFAISLLTKIIVKNILKIYFPARIS